MENWLTVLVVSLIFLLLSLTTLLILSRILRSVTETTQRVAEQSTEATKATIALLSKSLALIAAKDPMAYQAITTMDGYAQYTGRYDPSDEAEMDRLRAFGRVPEEDDLNGDYDADAAEAEERRFLEHIGVPSADF